MPSAHPPRNARQVHPGALRDSSGNLLPPSTRCPLEKPLPLLHLLPPCCVRWNKAVLRSKCAGSRHSSPFSGRQSLLGSCPQHYQDRAVGSLSQARPPLCPALPPESPALVPAYLPLSPARPPARQLWWSPPSQVALSSWHSCLRPSAHLGLASGGQCCWDTTGVWRGVVTSRCPQQGA